MKKCSRQQRRGEQGLMTDSGHSIYSNSYGPDNNIVQKWQIHHPSVGNLS